MSSLIIPDDLHNARLDKALAELCEGQSRSRLQDMIGKIMCA